MCCESQFHAGPRLLRLLGAVFNVGTYLPRAWQKFRSAARINNFSQMCVYLAILQLKVMNKKLIKGNELQGLNSTRDQVAMSWVALREIIPPTHFGWDDVVQKTPISLLHYNDIMCMMPSQITSLMIVYSTVYSRRRSNRAPKLCVTGLCMGNSPVTSEFPVQMASNAEDVSIWWCHHESVY